MGQMRPMGALANASPISPIGLISLIGLIPLSCKKNSSEQFLILKSEMMRLFLCEARRRKRSIVSLCEHFGDRSSRAKRTHQNDFNKQTAVADTPFSSPSKPKCSVVVALTDTCSTEIPTASAMR